MDSKQVSREEFYAATGNKDVHPTTTGPWPYTSIFKFRNGVEFGRIVDRLPRIEGLPASTYFLSKVAA